MPAYFTPETLVAEIVRAFKVATMYPEGHPGRNRFFNRLIENFSAYLQQRHVLEIIFEKRSAYVDGHEVRTSDGSAELLARECFLRQIRSVKFLEGVTEGDFGEFFKLLNMDPEAVRDAGGALEVVRPNLTGSLQLDQVDYAGILEKRVEKSIEDGSRYGAITGIPVAALNEPVQRASNIPSFHGADEKEVSQEEWLEDKLSHLDDSPTETQYRLILKDILMNLKNTEGLNLPLTSIRVLQRLGQHLLFGGAARNPVVIRAAIRELAKVSIVEELAGQLTIKDQPQRENIQAVLDEVKSVSIPILLQRLADEEETFGRGAILNALERYGEAVRPHLEKWLQDDRWYVVRNAIGLMQQVGGPGDSTTIREFLDHPNSKVRLEALRFLYRHPVNVSEERMARLLDDKDPEVQARAVYALGVLLGPKGLKRLKSLARKPFLGEGDVPMREMAIRGIGRQGGQNALSFLMGLLRKRSFIQQGKGERIRKAVVGALAEVNDPLAVRTVRRTLPRLRGEALRTAEEFLRREEGKDSEREDVQD